METKNYNEFVDFMNKEKFSEYEHLCIDKYNEILSEIYEDKILNSNEIVIKIKCPKPIDSRLRNKNDRAIAILGKGYDKEPYKLWINHSNLKVKYIQKYTKKGTGLITIPFEEIKKGTYILKIHGVILFSTHNDYLLIRLASDNVSIEDLNFTIEIDMFDKIYEPIGFFERLFNW